ncbi:MAG: hypothetical protein AMJ61_12145 [Desulfobacterales bacterium SG8_35_2]|nr:MAG: hypothetical protein AMJ61_12145 [Desulfobacterales bacterium SG8_35_2]
MRLFLTRFVVIMLLAPVILLFVTGASHIIWGEVIMPEIKVITLPKPDTEGTVPLESTLQKRRSVRYYKDSSISIKLISQLLWSAQGITNQQGFRTAPSAGALYPLELYITAINVDGLETGIYKYSTADHTLMLTSQGDYSQKLLKAALWQDAISQAPAVFVISGVEKKTTSKYGNRGVRYIYIEAGHAAQNLCLQAEALGLGSVTIGAFTDHEVARILQMQKGEAPIYIIPVGQAK